MKDPLTSPLSPEETALAARLRALPGGEPSPQLDARIRAEAHAAVRAPRARPTWQRWGGALAAVLALGVGLRVMLQPASLPTGSTAPIPVSLPTTPSADSLDRAAQVKPAELQQADSEMAEPADAATSRQALPEAMRSDHAAASDSAGAAPARLRDARAESSNRPEPFPDSSVTPRAEIDEREAKPAAPARRSAPAIQPAPPAPPPAPTEQRPEAASPRSRLDASHLRPAAPPVAAPSKPAQPKAQSEASGRSGESMQDDVQPMRAKRAGAERVERVDEARQVGASAMPEAFSAAPPLAELIGDARRQHAANDLAELRRTLAVIGHHYPGAELPDDIEAWMLSFDARR